MQRLIKQPERIFSKHKTIQKKAQIVFMYEWRKSTEKRSNQAGDVDKCGLMQGSRKNKVQISVAL